MNLKLKIISQPKATKDSPGFTVVELIVSIIIGVIFVSLLQMSVTNYQRIAQNGRDLSLANSYVEGKVESIRNLGYNNLALGTTNLDSELPAALKKPKSANIVVTDQGNGIKKAVVTINYTSRGMAKTYSYTTFIGELGVGQ